jgi:hypothetical protein
MSEQHDRPDPDAPLRLAAAAKIAFPLGGISASSLRREAKRGRLAIEIVAGKQFTTLRAIERMREACRVDPAEPGCGFRPAFKGKDGITRQAAWIIRDGTSFRSTGCARENREGAERALAYYLAEKHGRPSRQRDGDPAEIYVTQVLNIYLQDVAPTHARAQETQQRVLKLGEFWEPFVLAEVTGDRCREYVKWRTRQKWKSAIRGEAARSVSPRGSTTRT